MNNKNETRYVGIGTTGLLLVAFVVLRLCNIINWSWVWVLSPLWVPIALALVVTGILVVCALIANEFDKKRSSQNKRS